VVGGYPRSSATSSFDRAHTISHSCLIETMRLPCTFLEIRELFVEIHQLRPTPSAFSAPSGVTPFGFRKDFWHQKTRGPGLSSGIVCVRFSRFSRTPICDIHKHTHTHTHTDRHGIYRTQHSSRGKNHLWLVRPASWAWSANAVGAETERRSC